MFVEEIEVNYLGCGSWYPATYVESVDLNNSKICYVDGNLEEVVENDWIRKITKEGEDENNIEEQVSSVRDVRLDSLEINVEETETNNIQQNHQNNNHHHNQNHNIQIQQNSPNIILSATPSPSSLLEVNGTNNSPYLPQNGQSSLPSTVTSIGGVNYSNAEIEYQHKIGIESDNVLFLTEYEILNSLGKLHGLITKKYLQQQKQKSQETDSTEYNPENDEIYNQLCEITRNYYNEASNNAFEKGKVAYAMKCLEEVREYE